MVKPVMYQTRRTYDSLLSYLETVVFPSDLCYRHKKKRHILFSCMGLSNFQWLITSNHIEEKTKLSVYMESKVWFYYYENTNATKKIIGYFIYHIWELIWKLTILLLCENILFPCNNMVLSVYRILFISHPRTTVRLSTIKIRIFSKVKQDRLKMDLYVILAPCWTFIRKVAFTFNKILLRLKFFWTWPFQKWMTNITRERPDVVYIQGH